MPRRTSASSPQSSKAGRPVALRCIKFLSSTSHCVFTLLYITSNDVTLLHVHTRTYIIHAYMHACIHTYIHTDIQACIHAGMQADLCTYVQTKSMHIRPVHTWTHSCMPTFTHNLYTFCVYVYSCKDYISIYIDTQTHVYTEREIDSSSRIVEYGYEAQAYTNSFSPAAGAADVEGPPLPRSVDEGIWPPVGKEDRRVCGRLCSLGFVRII